ETFLPDACRGAALRDEEPAEAFAKDSAGYLAWRGLQPMLLPAMTTLCRLPPARQLARKSRRILESLEQIHELHNEAGFLWELLHLADDMELLVIHVPLKRGYRVRLEAVGRNFHLFSLLQDALIGDPDQGLLPGKRPDPDVVATARGELYPQGGVSDRAE